MAAPAITIVGIGKNRTCIVSRVHEIRQVDTATGIMHGMARLAIVPVDRLPENCTRRHNMYRRAQVLDGRLQIFVASITSTIACIHLLRNIVGIGQRTRIWILKVGDFQIHRCKLLLGSLRLITRRIGFRRCLRRASINRKYRGNGECYRYARNHLA